MATRILLIEDEPLLVSLYTMVLVKAAYDVQSALDAETGEMKVVTERPHVVLLDLLIPKSAGGDTHGENIHEPIGFQILRLVKGTPSLQSIRVIILSNLDSDEHLRMANELGADRYLVKANLDPHDLTKNVEEVLHSTAAPRKPIKVPVKKE
ncbi:MAG: response regulator [Patescibacteria group bacterium]